jgi:hypothetical protein
MPNTIQTSYSSASIRFKPRFDALSPRKSQQKIIRKKLDISRTFLTMRIYNAKTWDRDKFSNVWDSGFY